MDALPRPSLKARADINASIALARFFIIAVSWSRVSARTIEKKNKKSACVEGLVMVSYGLQGKLGLRRVAWNRSLPNGN